MKGVSRKHVPVNGHLANFKNFVMDMSSLERTFSGSNPGDMDSLLCHICGGDLAYCSCSMSPGNIELRDRSEQTSPATHGEILSVVQGPSVSEDRKQVCPLIRWQSQPLTTPERRKQQNRNAQEKYREKQGKVLKDALRRIEILDAELASVKSEREHFRALYENLETQLLEIRSGHG